MPKKDHFHQENSLLSSHYHGSLVINKIIDNYKGLLQYTSLVKRLKVLIDCRSVEFQVEPPEIDSAKIALEKGIGNFEGLSEAILVTQPYTTAIATIFMETS